MNFQSVLVTNVQTFIFHEKIPICSQFDKRKIPDGMKLIFFENINMFQKLETSEIDN